MFYTQPLQLYHYQDEHLSLSLSLSIYIYSKTTTKFVSQHTELNSDGLSIASWPSSAISPGASCYTEMDKRRSAFIGLPSECTYHVCKSLCHTKDSLWFYFRGRCAGMGNLCCCTDLQNRSNFKRTTLRTAIFKQQLKCSHIHNDLYIHCKVKMPLGTATVN